MYNPTRDRRERIGRLLQMHANKREEIKAVKAGDIAAAIGLKVTKTGDTLCDEDNPIILERMRFPTPVVSVAIEPKTRADQEKLYIALDKLSEEDPTAYRGRVIHWFDRLGSPRGGRLRRSVSRGRVG